MARNTPDKKPPTSDSVLDLLLDALMERQAAREAGAAPAQPKAEKPGLRPVTAKAAVPRKAPQAPGGEDDRRPGPGEEGWKPPERAAPIHLERMLVRFLVLVAVLVVAINVPVNQYGVSLARILPDSAALVIRDGLVLKGSGPQIYILQNDRLRWISSMDAFEHLGLDWGDVHVVEDTFLERFEQGPPFHVLLKCPDSPHIYRLENDQKRWIKDIDTFLNEGHVWDDVRFVSCEYLRSIPDGPPIPEDAGPPPQL